MAVALALAGASAATLGGQRLVRERGLSALHVDAAPGRADLSPPREVSLPGGERRLVRDVRLETGGAGTAAFTLSRPVDRPGGRLPLVVVLAGFRTGREALELIPSHGDALLVAYEYPYSAERWRRGPKWRQVSAAREAVLRVPAQVAAVKQWLQRRGRADRRRTALLGFSFGALFAPAAQAVAAERGSAFEAVGLAYGGAGIERLVRHSLDLDPGWLEPLAARAISAAVAPVEPARHLPGLPGTFMLVHGRDDPRIPAESAELATRLTPRPRTVLRVGSGHLHPSRTGLLRRLGTAFRAWLAEEGILRGDARRRRDSAPSVVSKTGG